jgi:prolyl oligopeptidase
MRSRSLVLSAFVVGCGGVQAPASAPRAAASTRIASASMMPSVPAQVCGNPPARTAEVVEAKFGLTLSDPYRWMEGNDNAELATWLRTQGDCTQRYLGRIAARDGLLKRLRELGLGTSSLSGMQVAGGRSFFQQVSAGEQLPKLVVREADGKRRVLVDPATRGQGDSHASVNAFAPSPDGKLVAYDLALGGGEVSTIRVMDVATGVDRPDGIERVWGELGAQWLPDGKSFLYTQMAPPSPGTDPMLNMQVRLHVLGRPVASDVPLLGAGVNGSLSVAPEEFLSIEVVPGTSWAIAVLGGAHRESRVAVAALAALDRTGAGKTPWQKVADYADQVEDVFVHGDRLYMSTFKDASNRKIVSVALASPDLSKARVELPESPDAIIVSFAGARDAAYVETMVNGRARLMRVPWGAAPSAIGLPYDGWIDSIATDPLRDGARFDLKGWTHPAAFYDVGPNGMVTATDIVATTTADYANIEVQELEVRSADGAAVPLSILYPKDLPLDGAHPAILSGYAAYGTSLTPNFNASRLGWLERGATYAICHARGGGEKGWRWQADGSRERKMNSVRDFEACAQFLVDHKFTSPSHLAAFGRSAGGILVGRAVTDRPDLFAAANIGVGIVNPTRLLFAENGANQKFELGDPETEAGFKSLVDMDAFLHVAPGAAYPAVIFTVGLNDKRVAPWMTGKMAARMQASSTSGRPVLVRTEVDAGHGIGSTRDQVAAELADVYAFALAAAGDPAFQPQ